MPLCFFLPVSTPVFECLFKRFSFCCCCCCCCLLFISSQLPSTTPEKFRCHDDKHDQLLTDQLLLKLVKRLQPLNEGVYDASLLYFFIVSFKRCYDEDLLRFFFISVEV